MYGGTLYSIAKIIPILFSFDFALAEGECLEYALALLNGEVTAAL